MAISKRWPAPEQQYRQWYKSKGGFELGEVQFVQVESDTWVANMIGQHNIIRDQQGKPPIRYEAVLSGLQKIRQFALENNATVHMPRIGCGLAGGTWDKIKPMIESALTRMWFRLLLMISEDRAYSLWRVLYYVSFSLVLR